MLDWTSTVFINKIQSLSEEGQSLGWILKDIGILIGLHGHWFLGKWEPVRWIHELNADLGWFTFEWIFMINDKKHLKFVWGILDPSIHDSTHSRHYAVCYVRETNNSSLIKYNGHWFSCLNFKQACCKSLYKKMQIRRQCRQIFYKWGNRFLS